MGAAPEYQVNCRSGMVAFDPNQAFWIVDSFVPEDPQSFVAGDYPAGIDLSQWFRRVQVTLNISITRWDSELFLKQPDGHSSPLQRGTGHGSWSAAADGTVWFTNYWYFDATATYNPDLPWWLYDTGHEQSSALNSTDLVNWTAPEIDTDEDGLPDWYEYMLGTDINSADSDNDGIGDWLEVWLGRNPLNGQPPVTGTFSFAVFTPLE